MKYPGVESSTLEFKRELPKNDQIIKLFLHYLIFTQKSL